MRLGYEGIIAIKKHNNSVLHKILLKDTVIRLFLSRFLKERSAEYDFVFDPKLLLVGTENVNHYYVVVRSHGDMPKVKCVNQSKLKMMKY